MKLYMDDERRTPEGFDVRAYTAEEAIEYLSTGEVTVVSLDHDLGLGRDGTYVINWLEEKVFTDEIPLPKIIVHTANPVARTRMHRVAMRLWRAKAPEMKRDEGWALRPEVNYASGT